MSASPAVGRLPVVLHGNSTILGQQPLCILTPAAAWSYAGSVAVEADADRQRAVELVVQVREGSAGVSFVDPHGQNLRHEVMVSSSSGLCRVHQAIDRHESGMVMIRTGAVDRAAVVEIHHVEVRPLTAAEMAAADVPSPLQPVEHWNAFFGNCARSIPEQLRSLRYGRMQGDVQLTWMDGLSVVLAPHEQISRAVYVSGLYEPDTALVLKSWLHPGAVFLDVGANIGLFTLLGSRWVGTSGRVIAFEPSARERERLAVHVRLNNLENVDVIAAAAADHEGTGELLLATSEHSGLNTLAPRFAYAGVTAAEAVSVPLVTLDSVVERAALTRVDVIKLDIEGGECAALKGAAAVLRRFRPRLVIEVVEDALQACGGSAAELEELLDRAGYDLFDIDEQGSLRRIHRLPRAAGNVAALPRES